MNKILLFLDTETTGLSIQKAEIVQIAAIAYKNREWAGTVNLSCQPFNYEDISQEALKVNGLPIEKLKTFDDPVTSFRKFIHSIKKIRDRISHDSKFIAVAHNASFDKKFLKKWWQDCSNASEIELPKMSTFFEDKWIDTLGIARELHSKRIVPSRNIKLESLAEHFSVSYEGRGAHDALSDTEVLYTVYTKMEEQARLAMKDGKRLRCKSILESMNV